MNKTIVIDNTKYKVEDDNFINSGGEAAVYKINNQAVKLYHKSTKDRNEKIKKLVESGINFPSTVCAPKKLVYSLQGQIIGFAMNLLTGQNEVVYKLSTRKERSVKPFVNSKFITETLINGYQTIVQCHPHLIIGDNNDLNVLYNEKSVMTYIDADSFQFDKYPCIVGTVDFLPPELYNLDLTKKCYYKTEHDWYSWFCMFIRSLLMVHPYGGTCQGYNDIPKRATDKITCFDSGVIRPKVSLSPDILNNEIKSLFDRMFKKGERFVPPLDVFLNYKESLIQCNSCYSYYPGTNKNCPQCSTINIQQIHKQSRIVSQNKSVTAEELIKTNGKIVWNKIFNKTIYAVALNKDIYVLYIKHPDKNVEEKVLFNSKNSGAMFDLFEDKYLAYIESHLSDDILIFDIEKSIKGLVKKPVSDFGGEKVFACSKTKLYRIYEGFLIESHFNYSVQSIIDNNIRAVIKNQTWMSSSASGESLFLLQRCFNTWQYSIIQFKQNKHSMWSGSISNLEENESIIDRRVYFSGNQILVLLKTEISGKTFTRSYIMEEDKIIYKNKVASISSEIYKNIDGKAFVSVKNKIIILHPTDSGIVQEIIDLINSNSQNTLLKQTEPYVDDESIVYPYEKGIVVVNENNVCYLTIN